MPDEKTTPTLSTSTSSVRRASIGWLVTMLSRRMDGAMSKALETAGVSIDQFKIMMTLMEFEGISQREIGEKVHLPSYAVTRLLDGLEEQALIARKPDKQSRRSFSIRLTAKGRRMGPKLHELVRQVNEQVLAPIQTGEEALLKEILEKLVHRAE